MELKVICNCGQKYKFDVEPVNARMPFPVSCPVCAVDGTQLANSLLAQMPEHAMAAPMPVAALASTDASASAPAGLRLNRTAAPPPPPVAPPIPASAVPSTKAAPRPSAVPKYMQTNPATQTNNFLLGIVGALLGATVAVGFMVGSRIFFGFSFPLFGTIMGAMIGLGARLLYRGTDSSLGGVAALIAFFTVGGTLYLMFGVLGLLMSLMAIVIGTAAAFKIASG